MRWATLNGWWYGRLVTPVPSRIWWLCWAAAARNISGDAIVSQPEEWCSPHQNSSKAQSVEVGDECEIALELQHRVLADRVVGREKAAELDVGGHGCDLREPTRCPAGRVRCQRRSVAVSHLDVTHRLDKSSF